MRAPEMRLREVLRCRGILLDEGIPFAGPGRRRCLLQSSELAFELAVAREKLEEHTAEFALLEPMLAQQRFPSGGITRFRPAVGSEQIVNECGIVGEAL